MLGMSCKGFTYTEAIIGIILIGLVILAVVSVDITSRRFFADTTDKSRIQDEVKIAMEHIAKNLRLGIGNMTNPSTPVGDIPHFDDTRGFFILNYTLALIGTGNPGPLISVKIDTNNDGEYTPGVDTAFSYLYDNGTDGIIYYPDTTNLGVFEYISEGMITNLSFIDRVGSARNEVEVTIQALRDPAQASGPDNPQTSLTSSIVLRMMSSN